MTFLVTALPSEAKPLVERFGLRPADSSSPFRIYRTDDLCLIVSGVGRAASAAASAYAFARVGEPRGRPWINVGIAGHGIEKIGSCWLASKVSDASSPRSWYPSLVFDAGIPSAEVVTVGRPEKSFERNALYDMEASAFFATASRFSPVELIHVFKVVSDNHAAAAESLTPAKVTGLISARVDEVAELVRSTVELADSLATRKTSGADLAAWMGKRHFTFSQKRRLGELLHRLQVLEQEPAAPCEVDSGAADARTLLLRLEERLQGHGVGF